MATPTLDADVIVKEGLQRAGFPDPSAAQIKRAKDVWLPEIINKVVTLARLSGIGVMQVFETTAIAVGVINQRRYQLPSDYDQNLLVSLLDGDETGTATAGNVQSVTLAADEGIAQADAEGSYVLMTAGASAGQWRQITSYSTTTKVASVEAAWDTGKTPISGDTYVVVDEQDAVPVTFVPEIDTMRPLGDPGQPCEVGIHNGEFIFDRPLDKTYGIRLRYFADPAKIDVADSRWTDLFVRWQHGLTLGIEEIAMDNNDDARADVIQERFAVILAGIIAREQPARGQFEGFTVGG